jgi:uncharacterized protein YpmS
MPQTIANEPFYWTWNFILTLFLTVVVLPAVASMIVNSFKRQFEARDKKDEKIATLLAEKDASKEISISEWRTRFSSTQCAIKEKLDELAENMHDKVDWRYCKEREGEIKQLISRLDDRMRPK